MAVVGAGTADEASLAAALAVGRELGRRDAVLVCGGLGGVMEAACRGAREEGGLTVGVLPGLDRRAANPHVQVALATGLGEARNALVVRAADAVIAVGGRVRHAVGDRARAEGGNAGRRDRDLGAGEGRPRGRGDRAGRGRRGGRRARAGAGGVGEGCPLPPWRLAFSPWLRTTQRGAGWSCTDGFRASSSATPPATRPSGGAWPGWVTNRDDGAVEAVFEGDGDAVDAMVAFCREGPSRADVDHVEESEEGPEGLSGFDVR